MTRSLVLPCALGTLTMAGCHDLGRPTAANVVFEDLSLDTVPPDSGMILAVVRNIGNATAGQVIVYWHSPGSSVESASPTTPRDLAAAAVGTAPMTFSNNPAWTLPTGVDSIRWGGR